MKKLRSKVGHTQYETMTIAELREELSRYPDDMAVLATWEGIYTAFNVDNIDIDYIAHVHPDDAQNCVIIDVEY